MYGCTINYIFFLFVWGVSLEEMANMPSYNLLEIVHNKWLQQSDNHGNDLSVATCNNKIFMSSHANDQL
jgi:hypothetical protein